jgi:two-component system, OmpR family, sensor histidine kinase KdpD
VWRAAGRSKPAVRRKAEHQGAAPERLLARLQSEPARPQRGRLRIFFGAAAGVGKTNSMLEAARTRQAAGSEVVIGYAEPHGRSETARLLEGLERLPLLAVSHQGVVCDEFDLDAALQRHPQILLVDELAHSNLLGGEPAPRHPKRWQDIEELLEAGIDVWTTLNVQHLESLSDLVMQISGLRQGDTVPDRVFGEADEVELIDLPSDDLLARLEAGKVHVPVAAAHGMERFFRKPNLLALREIALRRVADRVEARARALPGGDRLRPRLAGEHILVATGPDVQSEQLVRAGKRLADALDAQWSVVYVETPALLRLSDAERSRRIDILRLGESLGAETVTLDGPTATAALMEYARTRNATRVLVGSPKRRGLSALLRPSSARGLARGARGFDVIIIAPTNRSGAERAARSALPQAAPVGVPWARYAGAFAISLICTAVTYAMYPHFAAANLVMVYLLGVTVAGLRLGRGPSVATAVLNVAAFDFFFVPPRFSFWVADAQYLVTFAVMLAVALVIANLTASVRRQTRVAGARRRRTVLLYAMSRELAVTRGIPEMARVAVRHVAEVFDCAAVVLLADTRGRVRYHGEAPLERSLRAADLSIAQWVADHGRQAGLGTDTLPEAPALYVPLGDSERRLGVLVVLPANPRRVLLPEQRHLLETFAAQTGMALERSELAEQAEAGRLAAERENLRNALLASISHDLRTPLAAMASAGNALAERNAALGEATRHTLARSIESKANEMSALIGNVLELMRFESGQGVVRRDWQNLADLLRPALALLGPRLAPYALEVRMPGDLPEVYVDAALVAKVFTNLLDNIVKYTPAGTQVTITAAAQATDVRVTIDDSGPGLPSGEPALLFEKFQRGDEPEAAVGVGLGLAMCRAIVRAHGGDIEAYRRPSGGARFEFTLPQEEPRRDPM